MSESMQYRIEYRRGLVTRGTRWWDAGQTYGSLVAARAAHSTWIKKGEHEGREIVQSRIVKVTTTKEVMLVWP